MLLGVGWAVSKGFEYFGLLIALMCGIYILRAAPCCRRPLLVICKSNLCLLKSKNLWTKNLQNNNWNIIKHVKDIVRTTLCESEWVFSQSGLSQLATARCERKYLHDYTYIHIYIYIYIYIYKLPCPCGTNVKCSKALANSLILGSVNWGVP